MAIDVLNARFSRVLEEIVLPNPYSGETPPNNEYRPIHPGYEYFANGWNGYKHWLVYTPYPNGNNQFENPTIAVSNDGKNWTEPAGITNPIVDTPVGGSDYNADTDLFYDAASDQLCVVYRERTTVTNFLQMLVSSDGINWGSPITLASGSTASQDYATPSLMFNGSNYRIYTINGDDAAAEKPVQYIESSSLTSGYGAPVTVSSFAPVNTTWWNLYIKWDGVKYVGFAQDASGAGGTGDTFVCESLNGTDFTTELIFPSSALYRSCFSLDKVSGEYLAFMAGVAQDQYIRATALKFDKELANSTRNYVVDLQGKAVVETLHGDNFVRPDQSGVGTSTDGSTPSLESGNWQISGNQLSLSAAGNSRLAYDVGSTSVFMRQKWGALAGQDQWAIVRLVDSVNYLRVGHSSAGNMVIQDIVSGSVAATAEFPFIADIGDNEEFDLYVTPEGIGIDLITTGGVSWLANTTFNTATSYGQQMDSTGKTVDYFIIRALDNPDRFVMDTADADSVLITEGQGIMQPIMASGY